MSQTHLIGRIKGGEQDMLVGDKLALKMTRVGMQNIVEWYRFYNREWVITDHDQTDEQTLLGYLMKEVDNLHVKSL